MPTESNKNNTLVLGMVWPSASYLRSGASLSATQTRDYHRLCALDTLPAHRSRVVALSRAPAPVPCESARFVGASISKRGASAVARLFSPGSIEFVYCDFFRFPGAYMDVAYRSLAEFAVELLRIGLLGDRARIVVPNRPSILAQFARLQKRGATAGGAGLVLEGLLPAEQNALYSSTAALQRRNKAALGGYRVEEQIRGFVGNEEEQQGGAALAFALFRPRTCNGSCF